MTYKTNRLILSLVAWAATLAIYIFYATGSSAPLDSDLAGWAKLMLKFVAIGVILQVIIQIIFHIVYAISIGVKNGFADDDVIERTIELSSAEDEMDKLIDLKACLVGLSVIGIGMLFALVSVAYFEYTAVMMMNIFFISALISALMVTCASIYYYQRGVRNG